MEPPREELDLWHLLAPVTFNVTTPQLRDTEHARVCALEADLAAEFKAIREYPAPTPLGVNPSADDDDEATATEDRDVEESNEDYDDLASDDD